MMSYWRSAITWLATSSGLYDSTPESSAEIEKRTMPSRRRQSPNTLPKLNTASLTEPSSDPYVDVNSNSSKLYSPNTSFSPTLLIPGVVNTPVILIGPSFSVNNGSNTLRRRVRSSTTIDEKCKGESGRGGYGSESVRDPEKSKRSQTVSESGVDSDSEGDRSRHLARRVTFATTDGIWQDMIREARFG